MEGFINSVDSKMRQRQDQQKLATISSRIDSYEAVEGSSEEVEKVSLTYTPVITTTYTAIRYGVISAFIVPFRSSKSTTALTLWFP